MLKNVAVVILDSFTAFELGVLCEVFGTDRRDEGLPAYNFSLVAGEPGPLRSVNGFTIDVPHDLTLLAGADLVAISAVSHERVRRAPVSYPEPLLDALRDCVARGTRVLSVCTGAYVLAAAGLLDGRRCTTHWRHVPQFSRLFPDAKLDPAVLYVDDDPVITSAGTAAGIDACLYLVRQEQGSRVANGIARRMVVPPHRDGGQAQYVERPLAEPACDTMQDILTWMSEHLGDTLTVDQMAARALMSARTFARRFVQETGTTPQRWLTGQRILLAQQLLEETGLTVDEVADQAGFGNATTLRHHFRSWRSTTPLAYRKTFRDQVIAPAAGPDTEKIP
jgi:transcriptional regulator GlxA family with amidase domain